MKIDYDAKRPLELDAIFGNTLRKVHSSSLNLPKIDCLYQQLKFLDERNQSKYTK